MAGPRLLAFNDLESVYDDPERVARLAGLIETRRDGSTVVCGAGDDTALGTLAVLSDAGRAAARPFFETVRPAVETFGNHDFDPGREAAFRWATGLPTTYLAANLHGPGTADVPGRTVVERNGRQVAFVGVVHPETVAVCAGIDAVGVSDPVPAVRQATATLDADRLVVLAHCGEDDERVARETAADVVIGGHVHSRRHERFDDTLLVRTAGGGSAVVEVALEPRPTATFHDPADAPADEALRATYTDRRRRAGATEPVATLETPVERTEAERFRRESRAGNFLADAVRRAVDADCALFPAGTLRTGPPLSGTVTAGDVVSLAPFGDPVRRVRIDGARLRETLDGAAVPNPGDRGWIHAHVSGLRVRWNADGSLRRVSHDGEPVTDGREYTVAVTGWLVAAGEQPFAPIRAEHVTNGDADGAVGRTTDCDAPDDPRTDDTTGADGTDDGSRGTDDQTPIADADDTTNDETPTVYEAALAHAHDGGLVAATREGRIAKDGE